MVSDGSAPPPLDHMVHQFFEIYELRTFVWTTRFLCVAFLLSAACRMERFAPVSHRLAASVGDGLGFSELPCPYSNAKVGKLENFPVIWKFF